MVLRLIFNLKILSYLPKIQNRRFASDYIKLRRAKMDLELKSRDNPIALKLDTPEFKNLFTDELKSLRSLFDKHGYELRIAGGAVRDLLLGKQPTDLDFATTVTPDQMKDMFTAENIRMINANGEKHGTITPRINDKENFEVTTLRIDVVTDGRRAEVMFTTDWKLDANRRDLTINSMFLGFDGSVYDFFYGYDDLLSRRVVFVGDPNTRIREDYLRILRYFRFYGRIAKEPNRHENDILQTIADNVDGLQCVSGERIWTELKKILMGNYAGELMKSMIDVGMGKYMGLPEQPNITEFNQLWERSSYIGLHPMSLVAALLYNVDDVIAINNRLKFSAYDRDLTLFIVQNREAKISVNNLLPYQKLIINSKLKQKDIVCYVQEILKYKNEMDLLKQITNWQIPRLPVNGQALKENGVPPGRMQGYVLYQLRDRWADNNFTSTAEELIKAIPDILSNYKGKK